MAFSIYIHIPFCEIQCPYCTFYTVFKSDHASFTKRFLASLLTEWRLRVIPRLNRGDQLKTLYLGGGTPSDLPVEDLLDFLRMLEDSLGQRLSGLQEVTIECNPESTTPGLLDGLKKQGIHRISLGVQAMNDQDLKTLGRKSTTVQNRTALSFVAERFATWNVDLILGIPGSNLSLLEKALQEICDFKTPHLSFYCLEVPPMRAHLLGDTQDDASDTFKADLYEFTSAWVQTHGFEHYEISNAAHPGHRAIHNTAYWEGQEYVGLGPGAHSFENDARRANLPRLTAYIEALEQGKEPPSRIEKRSPLIQRQEALLLGLRTEKGLDLVKTNLIPQIPFLQSLQKSGLAKLDAETLRLTPRGWLLSDAIISKLMNTL